MNRSTSQKKARSDPPLSPAQRRVLQGLADGLDLNAIAVQMRLPVYIVWTHAEHVLRLLDARSYAEAIVVARRNKWIA